MPPKMMDALDGSSKFSGVESARAAATRQEAGGMGIHIVRMCYSSLFELVSRSYYTLFTCALT